MAISRVGVGAVATGTTSLAPAYPGGYTAVADDLAVAYLGVKIADTGEFTTPSGWTKDATVLHDYGGTDNRTSVYYKKLTASESLPTWSGDTADIAAIAVEIWRGVDPTTPIDVTSVTSTQGQSEPYVPTGLTTTTDGAVVLSVVSMAAGDLVNMASGSEQGFTESFEYDTFNATNLSLIATYKSISTAGAVTCPSYESDSVVFGWAGVTVALRPATIGDPPTGTVEVSEWDHTLNTSPGAGSQASGSHSYSADTMYVAFITQKNLDSVEPDDPTLIGMGATWYEQPVTNGYWDQSPASMRKTSVFWAIPASSGTGTVTVSYATYDPDTIDIVILECVSGASIAQVKDYTGSWSANGALNEHVTMGSPSSSSARFVSYVAANVALVTQGSVPDPRMERSTDTGGDADWTTFTDLEYASSPTGFYASGWLDADPNGDLTPGWVQFDNLPAAYYTVTVEVSASTASPSESRGWGILAAQGTPAPPTASTMSIGAAISQGVVGGGPVGETAVEATARFNGYLTAAIGYPVDIQMGRRYSGNQMITNFSSRAEFAQDIGVRHRMITVKGEPSQAQIESLIGSIDIDGYDTHIGIHNEPENDGGDHTPTWFHGMCDNLHAAWLATGSRSDIKPSLTLTTWLERDSSGSTTSSDWFPTSNIGDFYLWMQPYDETGNETLEDAAGATLALWRAAGGVGWGISECGSARTGADLATWIRDGAAWIRANEGSGFLWFHSEVGIGILLDDPDGRLAFAQELAAQGGAL